MVKRAEVWWYEPPGAARHPHLILTRDDAIPVLNQVLAAVITSTRRGIPTEVDLDEADGMPRPCVIAMDNLTQVRPALCTERITSLGPERMAQVCEAFRAAVAC